MLKGVEVVEKTLRLPVVVSLRRSNLLRSSRTSSGIVGATVRVSAFKLGFKILVAFVEVDEATVDDAMGFEAAKVVKSGKMSPHSEELSRTAR